jgi:hypothetical protein
VYSSCKVVDHTIVVTPGLQSLPVYGFEYLQEQELTLDQLNVIPFPQHATMSSKPSSRSLRSIKESFPQPTPKATLNGNRTRKGFTSQLSVDKPLPSLPSIPEYIHHPSNESSASSCRSQSTRKNPPTYLSLPNPISSGTINDSKWNPYQPASMSRKTHSDPGPRKRNLNSQDPYYYV